MKFLPTFPDNKYLRDKWWHRLALIILISTFALVSFFSIGLAIVEFQSTFKEEIVLTPEEIDHYQNDLNNPKIIFKEQRNTKTGEKRWVGEQTRTERNPEYFLFPATVIPLTILVLSVLYRAILHIVFGDKWKEDHSRNRRKWRLR